MDEKYGKNETSVSEGFIPPSYARDLYNEKISNSIKIGFETLSNSLVECALILSSEEYAKSLVKEREDKKREKEAKKKEKEEHRQSMKECSEKLLKIYAEKLKDKIDSMDISDNKKTRLFHSLISNEPIQFDTPIISDFDLSQIVKKSFCDALKEVNPEVGKMITADSITFDPAMLALVIPGVTIPPLTMMALISDDNGKHLIDPLLMMMKKSV